MPVRAGKVVAELAVGDGRHLLAGVGAGLVEGHGVEAGEHAHIREDGRVVFAVAVAVGADVAHQRHVEAGAAMADGLRVLGHLAVEDLVGAVVGVVDGVERAGADAAAAALALVVVDDGLVVCVADGVAAALAGAAAATAAEVFVDGGLAVLVLVHLAGAAAAAHADVLQRAAEAGGLMALEVRQADEDVGVHDGAADLGGLAVLAVDDGHFHFVRAAQTVADDDLAAGGDGVEAVEVGAVHVLQGIFAAAGIERVAVREEGQAALFLAEVGDDFCIVGAQEGEIAQLAEVHFDGDEFALHVDGLDAGGDAEAAKFIELAGSHWAAEIRKIDDGSLHGMILLYDSPRASEYKLRLLRFCASRQVPNCYIWSHY